MLLQGFGRRPIRLAVSLIAAAALGVPAHASIPSASSAPSALTWEEGAVILTLIPAIPNPQPVIDQVTQIVSNPGGTIDDSVRGVHDYQRVCGGPQILVARFPSEDDARQAMPVLAAVPGVATVQHNHLIRRHRHVDPGPDADRFDQQWGLRNVGQELGYYHYTGRAGEDIQADGAWATGATGSGQVVAILDEGVNLSHPDLAPNVWVNQAEAAGQPGVDDDGNGWIDDVNGWDFVENDSSPRPMLHGTAVAGVVAAADDNRGVRGVAPGAKIMSVDFIDGLDPRSTTELRALGAFAYAIANGATVMNNSWGMYGPVGIGSPIMREAIKCAERHDIVMAWSAGNAGPVPDWPQAYGSDASIRSTSFDPKGCFVALHQSNPLLADVMAPGADVYTTSTWGGYIGMTGTSFASPHTAGVAALVREMYPDLTAPQVVTAIKAGVRRGSFVDPQSNSWGMLSADGALRAAGAGTQPAELSLEGDVKGSSTYRCNLQNYENSLNGLIESTKDQLGL